MVKISKDEQQLNETNVAKFFDSFSVTYSDDDMLKLYDEELPSFELKTQVELKALVRKFKNESDGDVSKEQIGEITKDFYKKLKYEKYFPKTIQYINERIFHGYDSKYYVSNNDDIGTYLAREYNTTDFNSTYEKYFPQEIKTWFNKQHRKYILTMNNEKPRTYDEKGNHFLNLFSGFKFDKFQNRDEDRIF
ncbi:hypothetical protein [Clostridium sp.]|uniref:hypothetical protein n=1 Tax=Clostridium sp. TaxID=1506 RepID=UPI002850CEDA|nr:hypothetical protein [Clostridium sp.]MDR3598615.1 hypothetical protein [Clostridium sp.]